VISSRPLTPPVRTVRYAAVSLKSNALFDIGLEDFSSPGSASIYCQGFYGE